MKYSLITALIIIFAGCSGKVQTNPIPDNTVVHLPAVTEINTTKQPAIDEAALKQEYDDFLKEKIFDRKVQRRKDIFEIGYKRISDEK